MKATKTIVATIILLALVAGVVPFDSDASANFLADPFGAVTGLFKSGNKDLLAEVQEWHTLEEDEDLTAFAGKLAKLAGDEGLTAAKESEIESNAIAALPDRFAGGFYLPVEVSMQPKLRNPKELEYVFRVPQDAPDAIPEIDGINPYLVDSPESFKKLAKWYEVNHGKGVMVLKKEVLDHVYFEGMEDVPLMGLRGKWEVTFVPNAAGQATVRVLQPDWYTPPPPKPEEVEIRFQPQAFNTTEGLFAFMTRIGLLPV